jgi:hypothetical protein
VRKPVRWEGGGGAGWTGEIMVLARVCERKRRT